MKVEKYVLEGKDLWYGVLNFIFFVMNNYYYYNYLISNVINLNKESIIK